MKKVNNVINMGDHLAKKYGLELINKDDDDADDEFDGYDDYAKKAVKIIAEFLAKEDMVGMFCCPFHHEHTPSFIIKCGRFHCFGCGVDGDKEGFSTFVNNWVGEDE